MCPVGSVGRRRIDIRTYRSVALATGLLVTITAPIAAASPTVVGQVTGKLPSSTRAATEVRAFDISRAVLVARATVRGNGSFRLGLPPGAYLLVTSITPE